MTSIKSMVSLNAWTAFAAFLPTLLKAVLLLVVCLIASRLLLALSGKLLNKSKLDKSLHAIIRSTLKVLLIFLTIMIVAPALGINTASLLAVLSIAGVAISLSVQGILGNFFSGVTLLMSKPFKVGDYVTIGGETGVIVETGITHTKLNTLDNQMILVPNSSVTSNVITNVSAEPTRRVDFLFTASSECAEADVLAAITEAADIEQALKDQPAFAKVSGYKDGAVEYTLRVWVKNEDYWDAYFAIMERIKPAYAAHGVTMAVPRVHILTK